MLRTRLHADPAGVFVHSAVLEACRKFGEKTAFRRPAQPEEIGPAYVFLASPVTGSYITGLVLPVIGGVTEALSSQKG